MAGDLDGIRVSTHCPRCGRTVVATYEQVRVLGAFGCSCGALLKIEGGAPEVELVQRLIDELGPPEAAND